MLNLRIHGGDKKSGWRYSPRKGQSELLDLLTTKLPHYVIENNNRAVWWRVFNPEAEATFLADVNKVLAGGNFEIETGGSPMKKEVENPYIGGDVLEFIDELVEEMDTPVRGGLSSDAAIDQIASITGCSVKRCEILGESEEYTLIKTPPIQGDDYIPSKVYKVSLYDLSYTEVWNCGQTKLGRLLKEKLIKEELG
jgi:hypothetical protein